MRKLGFLISGLLLSLTLACGGGSHTTPAPVPRRGPRASLVEIPGVGHAPMLLDDAQIAPVREFLGA